MTVDNYSSFGYDLGIRQGGIAEVIIDPNTAKVTELVSLVQWHKGPTVKATPEEVLLFFSRNILGRDSFADLVGKPVAIDWDPNEVFWRGRKRSANQKTLVMGFIYHSILSKGGIPLIFPPRVVRKALGLKSNTPKEQVWKRFLPYLDGEVLEYFHEVSEHLKDAIILAYLGKTFARMSSLMGGPDDRGHFVGEVGLPTG